MGVVTQVTRFSVYLIALDPTRGSEIRKTGLAIFVAAVSTAGVALPAN